VLPLGSAHVPAEARILHNPACGTQNFLCLLRKPKKRDWAGGLAQPFRNSISRVLRPCPCVRCRVRAGNLTSGNLRHNSELLSLPRGPLRLNFHHSFHSRKIVPEAAPRPLLRTRHQSSPHRIAMDVAQLVDSLGFAPNIEVVVSRLPERSALHHRAAWLSSEIRALPVPRFLGRGDTRGFPEMTVTRVGG
jgi:hypothetical protein